MSKASRCVYDQKTAEFIEHGKIDPELFTPEMKQIYRDEIVSGARVRTHRSLLSRIFGSTDDGYDEFVDRTWAEVDRITEESRESERRRVEYDSKHRLKTVPHEYSLLCDNKFGHSYSDGTGTIHHYNNDGTKMNRRQENDYLDKMYGSGD